jgi:hypothetical protein
MFKTQRYSKLDVENRFLVRKVSLHALQKRLSVTKVKPLKQDEKWFY